MALYRVEDGDREPSGIGVGDGGDARERVLVGVSLPVEGLGGLEGDPKDTDDLVRERGDTGNSSEGRSGDTP